jgi:hypothetical protein
MSKDWEKLAEDRFTSEEKDAKATARTHFAVSLFLGILVVVVFALVDGVRWFFFDQIPAKGDIGILLILIVVFPIVERLYAPVAEARAMRAKRAIRIEAKLDYLLSRHSLE